MNGRMSSVAARLGYRGIVVPANCRVYTSTLAAIEAYRTTGMLRPTRALHNNLHIGSGPKVPLSVPCPRDPTTWPAHWGAPEIEDFLKPHLKEGGLVNFRGLSLLFHGRELGLLRDNYIGQLKPVSPATIEQLHANYCQKILSTFHVCGADKNMLALKYRSKHILSDKYCNTRRIPACDRVVNLVTCDSGNGKTVEAIASICSESEVNHAVIFLCVAQDLAAGLESCKDSNARDAQFLLNVMAAVDSVPSLLDALRRQADPMVFGIVVDEAGGHTSVVRALCSTKSSIKAALKLCESTTVRASAAGTGLVSGDLPPGSHPYSYRATVLPPSNGVWRSLVAQGSVPKHVVAKIEEHGRGGQAIGNSRFARLLWDDIVTTLERFRDTVPLSSLDSVVDMWLASGALQFKRLNGLSTVPDVALLEMLSRSVRVAMLCNTPPSSPPVLDAPLHDDFAERNGFSEDMVMYGMIVDNAQWVNHMNTPPPGTNIWGTAQGGLRVLASKGPRFTLPVAQSAVIFLLLGLMPQKSGISGEALERFAATAFTLLVGVFWCHPASRLLWALGATPAHNAVISSSSAISALPAVRGDSMDVLIQRYHAPGSGLLDAGEVEGLDAGKSYVISSGPKCPFADLIVVIPHRALILVQCKDYGGAIGHTQIMEELYKMGHPGGTPPKVNDPKSNTRQKDRDTHARLLARQVDQHTRKKKTIQALKEKFKVPQIHYFFLGSNAYSVNSTATKFKNAGLKVAASTSPTAKKRRKKDARDMPAVPISDFEDVYFGCAAGLQYPLNEILPFDSNKCSDKESLFVGCVASGEGPFASVVVNAASVPMTGE